MYKSAFSSLDDNFFIMILFLSVQLFGCTSSNKNQPKGSEIDIVNQIVMSGWFIWRIFLSLVFNFLLTNGRMRQEEILFCHDGFWEVSFNKGYEHVLFFPFKYFLFTLLFHSFALPQYQSVGKRTFVNGMVLLNYLLI